MANSWQRKPPKRMSEWGVGVTSDSDLWVLEAVDMQYAACHSPKTDHDEDCPSGWIKLANDYPYQVGL